MPQLDRALARAVDRLDRQRKARGCDGRLDSQAVRLPRRVGELNAASAGDLQGAGAVAGLVANQQLPGERGSGHGRPGFLGKPAEFLFEVGEHQIALRRVQRRNERLHAHAQNLQRRLSFTAREVPSRQIRSEHADLEQGMDGLSGQDFRLEQGRVGPQQVVHVEREGVALLGGAPVGLIGERVDPKVGQSVARRGADRLRVVVALDDRRQIPEGDHGEGHAQFPGLGKGVVDRRVDFPARPELDRLVAFADHAFAAVDVAAVGAAVAHERVGPGERERGAPGGRPRWVDVQQPCDRPLVAM